jgi:hypothetical protein
MGWNENGPRYGLEYGDGIAGRDYYLKLGGEYLRLNEGVYSTLGGPNDEQAAREKAISLLQHRAPNLVEDAKTRKFTWNGWM